MSEAQNSPADTQLGVLSYRPVAVTDAKMLLDWRTRPDITRWSFQDIDYDLDHQKSWIEASATKAGFVHRIICVDGEPVGYCSITVTDAHSRIGTVGIYIADVRSGRMIVTNFIPTLNHAFFTMDLNKVVNHILAGNRRLLKVQAFNGYREVGVLRQQVLKAGAYHDVHVFEQLRADWAEFREKFKDYRDFDGAERPWHGNT